MTPRFAPVLLVMLAAPTLAVACPGCFGGTDPRVIWWFMASAVAMSLLPLAMIGGFVYWAAKRGHADRTDDAATIAGP
jgi:hypothetical protein